MTVIHRGALPISNGYIDRRIVDELQRQSVRGRGPNSSRGRPVVFGVGTSAGRIPQGMTLAAHVNQHFPGGFGPRMYAGTSRLGDPRQTALAGFTYEAGVLSYDARGDRSATSWRPPPGAGAITGVTVKEGQAYPIGPGMPINFSGEIVTFARGIGPGKLNIATGAGAAPPATNAEAEAYTAATTYLKSFNQQLRAGSIHPDSTVLNTSTTLLAPTSTNNQKLYDDYRFEVDRIGTSRTIGRFAWETAHPPAPPAAPGTTTPPGTTAPPSGGSSLLPGVTPVPIGTAPGYEIYPGGGGNDQLAPPQAGTTTIAFPGSKPPPAAPAPTTGPSRNVKGAAIFGVVALLAVGGYALSRRRKK